jgi:hypothetical protein
MYNNKRIQIVNRLTDAVVDPDAVVSPWLMCEGTGPAVQRKGVWLATQYPGFVVAADETVVDVRVRVVRG